jgi:protein-tyrosine phosphatase
VKYAIQFGLMSVAVVLVAIFSATTLLAQVMLIWIAISLAIVAAAYALDWPQLFMKRRDGSQPLLAWLLFWPYFSLARVSLLGYRWWNRKEMVAAEASPGLWFARRPTKREMRNWQGRWSAVLDLAAEFPRVAPAGVAYLSVPMLDGAAPPEAQVMQAVGWVREQLKGGNVLVHCALGHGRTGSVVLTFLLMEGHVAEAEAGVAQLRSLRGTFGMSDAQKAAAVRYADKGGDSEGHGDPRRSGS